VHIWLGWIVGIPLLIWTATGLFMAWYPIETVRGEALLAEPAAIASGFRPVAPLIGPRPVASLSLEQRSEGVRWVVRYKDGGARLADAATGQLLPPLNAADAARAVEARYQGESKLASISRTKAEDPPIDLRRKIDSWRVTMEDGTRFYVNVQTGEIAARRTALWRVYDFMWGLHIMDLKTREDTDNLLLFVLAIVSFVAVLLAIILLPTTIRRRRRTR
jgi:hypothetical protein